VSKSMRLTKDLTGWYPY